MNALGDGAPRSVAEARAATGAGAPLRAALRATAPLTACLHDNALREWRATDEEECGAGWFPASHVGEPTPNQIQRITDLLSRRENGVISGAASDALAVLAPPPTWAAVDARTDQGPVAYVEVDPRSKEYADAITAFKATLPDARATVSKLERVQNPGMWQAYRVRRHALLCREDDRARDNLPRLTRVRELERWKDLQRPHRARPHQLRHARHAVGRPLLHRLLHRPLRHAQ